MLCHSHPVQTNTPSATTYLGDPSCPLVGPASTPGWELLGGGCGMAVMPCPMSSISWVKRLGLVAWWGRGFLVTQIDSWTLETPLLWGALPTLKFSQWINQGSGHVTYQVTENPGLAQPQARPSPRPQWTFNPVSLVPSSCVWNHSQTHRLGACFLLPMTGGHLPH